MPALTARYGQALALRNVSCRTVGDEATWAGLCAVARALGAFEVQ